jgi:hypothetical protein
LGIASPERIRGFLSFFPFPRFGALKKKADVTFQKKADFMGIVIR